MYQNYVFNTINHAIPALFNRLLREGREVPSRNGATMELPFTGITLTEGTAREILIPGRKHNLAAQIAETMWVLSGRNDIEWLSQYLPRAKDYSDDGKTWRGGYGKRIRNWGYVAGDGPGDYSEESIDQLQHVVGMLKSDPATRQAVISIYDPAIDIQPGKDIPCNDFLHFLSREGTLDLHVFVRSNDMMWGWSGINVFEWSSLLEIVAGLTGLEVGSLHFSISSFHLYETHWEKAQQIADSAWGVALDPRPSSPRFDFERTRDVADFHGLCHLWFIIEEAIRKQAQQPTHERNLEDMIDDFPEPMLQSWLRVIAWWWTSEVGYRMPLEGTALFDSTIVAMQPLQRQKPTLSVAPEPFEGTLIDEIINLHNQKDAAYGDSWCRRGEMLGIMANIARKVDRLGGPDTTDETSTDTAMDLFVYLAKYRAWIDGEWRDVANDLMRTVSENTPVVEGSMEYLEGALREQFEALEKAVTSHDATSREILLAAMLKNAWSLVVLLAEAQ